MFSYFATKFLSTSQNPYLIPYLLFHTIGQQHPTYPESPLTHIYPNPQIQQIAILIPLTLKFCSSANTRFDCFILQVGSLTLKGLKELSDKAHALEFNLEPVSEDTKDAKETKVGKHTKDTKEAAIDVEKGGSIEFAPMPSLLARFMAGTVSLLGAILIGALLCTPAWPLMW